MDDHVASRRLDIRNRLAGWFLRLLNPLVRWLISAKLPTGAPNVLITTRGRRSGEPRTVPVGLLDLNGRRFVQASYGETGWVANVRANGEAILTYLDGRRMTVQAVELPAGEAGTILDRAIRPNRRSRLLRGLLRAVLGPRFRPPVGVLFTLGIRIDDTLEEYVADARRHPVFELRPLAEVSA